MMLDGERLCPCQIDCVILVKQKSYHLSYVCKAKTVALEILVSPHRAGQQEIEQFWLHVSEHSQLY